MSLPVTVAAAMFVGVVAYAVLGGADFGSGFYDLAAWPGEHGRQMHSLIDDSLGPVWEANHVWLIYVLVMWWTAFPGAFAAAMTTLFLPLALALAGIVLRGASFAFRKNAPTFGLAQLFGAVFAGASLITPYFLGTVAGALASGRVPAQGYGDPIGSWVNPTAITGGGLAVATCVFLAGVYLTADARRSGLDRLENWLWRLTLAVGLVVGAVVFGGLYPVLHDAPTLSKGLLGRGLPVLIIAAVAGSATIVLVYLHRYQVARLTAAAAVGTVVLGWAFGQYPWLLVDELTIDAAAGAHATLQALLVVVGIAVAVVLPSLGYLLWFTQRGAGTDIAMPD
jgi:cytochrome d ubiquinol oxidase subunit II